MDQHTTSTEHAAAPAVPRPLDPSRPALLPRLIDDVLLIILDELAQPDYTNEGYKLRQYTLRSVCLASRRLRVLAQPLLWRQVVVSADEPFEQLSQLGGQVGMCTSVGEIQPGLSWRGRVWAGHTGAAVLRDAVQHLTLVGADVYGLGISELLPFSNLRRLELVDVSPIQVHVGPGVALHNLEVLSFSDCPISPPCVSRWLTLAWLPRLKVLAGRSGHIPLPSAVAPCLAAQLDIIRVEKDQQTSRATLFTSSPAPAVVILNASLLERLPRHVMFGTEPHFSKRSPSLQRQSRLVLSNLVAEEPRADPAAPPRAVLMLPAHLLDTESAAVFSFARYAETWQGLVELCRERGRRVIWYDEREVEASLDIVPLEFRLYARELRARRFGWSASSSR